MSTDPFAPQALSFSGARWLPVDPVTANKPTSDPVATLLQQRGLDLTFATRTPDRSDLLDPHTMFGMDQALARIAFAKARHEKVRVVTDYDVDGTMSSLILQAVLARVAPEISLDYHIPDRFTEGYGLSTRAVDLAAEQGVKLIITADIGIRDHASVARAREHGIDVLIADHHLPDGARVPEQAMVLCPPQAACAYANPYLAACGVSLKLATALLEGHPQADLLLRSMLKLAAIGTISDLVPLRSAENRAIVTLGLHELNHARHAPGLTTLLQVAGAKAGAIDESTLGWQVGPRINAAGRMAHATLIVELLTTRDPATAQTLAHELDAHNRDRQSVQEDLVREALAQVPSDAPPAFIVCAGHESEGWHRGVLGIVAARVRDERHRPTAIVSITGPSASGSVRSLHQIHAVQALDSVRDLLLRYGGHPVAAGFTLQTRDLPVFSERIAAWSAEKLAHADLTPSESFDLRLDAAQLHPDLLGSLRRMGPFGMGNPQPVFRVNDVHLHNVRVFGRDKTHASAQIAEAPGVELVAWKSAAWADALARGPVDVLVRLERNDFGSAKLRAVMVDAREAAV